MLQLHLVESQREGQCFVHPVDWADSRFRDANGPCIEHEHVIEANNQLGIVKTSRARQADNAVDRDRGHLEIAVRVRSMSDIEIIAGRAGLECNTNERMSSRHLR